MPYRTRKVGKEWCNYVIATGEKVGCSKTRQQAIAQLRAIAASESGAKELGQLMIAPEWLPLSLHQKWYTLWSKGFAEVERKGQTGQKAAALASVHTMDVLSREAEAAMVTANKAHTPVIRGLIVSKSAAANVKAALNLLPAGYKSISFQEQEDSYFFPQRPKSAFSELDVRPFTLPGFPEGVTAIGGTLKSAKSAPVDLVNTFIDNDTPLNEDSGLDDALENSDKSMPESSKDYRGSVPQSVADYDPLGMDIAGGQACATCFHFQPDWSRCRIVEGVIVATGMSKFWLSKEEVDAAIAEDVEAGLTLNPYSHEPSMMGYHGKAKMPKGKMPKDKMPMHDDEHMDDEEEENKPSYRRKKAMRFSVKTVNGKSVWFAWWTNNLRDRDKEAFSGDAIDRYVSLVKGGYWPYPKLWWRHYPIQLGKATWMSREGAIAMAAGEFDDTPVGKAFAKHYQETADDDATSHGYLFPAHKRVGGNYHEFYTFEISPLPWERASNPYTHFEEVFMAGKAMSEGDKQDLRNILGNDLANEQIARVQQANQTIEQKGILGLKELGIPVPEGWEGQPVQQDKANATPASQSSTPPDLATLATQISQIQEMQNKQNAGIGLIAQRLGTTEQALADLGAKHAQVENAIKEAYAWSPQARATQSPETLVPEHHKQLELLQKANKLNTPSVVQMLLNGEVMGNQEGAS